MRRGFLRVLATVPGLSLLFSLLVHGGAIGLLVATSLHSQFTAPQVLSPEGVAVAEIHLVEQPTRSVARPPKTLPTPAPEVLQIPLKIVPPICEAPRGAKTSSGETARGFSRHRTWMHTSITRKPSVGVRR